MVGAAISVPVTSALQSTHTYRGPGAPTAVPDGASLANVMGSAWPVAATLVTLTTLGMVLPPALLLTGAIVLSHGLGIAALQAPLAGPLLISDVLLLIHLLRVVAQRRTTAVRSGWVSLWLALFLAWSFLATLFAGMTVTPLLRIAVYCAVFLLLSRRGTDRRLVYLGVLCYALTNLVGGVLEGQPRLVGMDIGDPFQTGALLLAALCPLLTSELRFRGGRFVGAVLLCGIFLTQTRSVWFATVVVLVVWAQKKLSAARIVTILAGLGLAGLQMVDLVTQWLDLNTFSAVLRRQSVINGISSGLKNPAFGSGWGHVSSMVHFQGWNAIRQVMPYNLFVYVFASVGLPALLALVLFLGELLRRLACRRGAPLLFTVAMLSMSLTEMTLYAGSMQTLLFFVYAGMGLGPAWGERQDADPKQLEPVTELRNIRPREHRAKADVMRCTP
ncbi:O-antigen ligase family protein [Streptomyces sp. NBC_01217]|uniref:O-antigen ligase family protein n=1 Tax=Streptomyces sp. NBC_01217 TaxID=2903779 RepID=UPI002E10C540|nr:O-antigen ligase family protein [Streptomyces sp. NBC_01217]